MTLGTLPARYFPGLIFDAISIKTRQRVTAWQNYGESTATVYYTDKRVQRCYSFAEAQAFAEGVLEALS